MCAVAFAAVALPMSSQAEQKPLWEAGLGIGAVTVPDYRGSDQSNVYPVPLPYFIYRGKFFKADREGVRGELFDKRYLELSLSFHASTPVRDDNEARRGMPNLRPTLEFGPSLDVHVWRSASEEMKLDLVMPLRLPITLESSPQTLGWVFAPRLNLDIENVAGQQGWNFGIGAGPVFGAAEYHEYIYSVAPSYATDTRPAYDARGGYAGTQVLTAISKRFPKYWIGAYISYQNLHNAAYEDSPLVRQQNYLSGGIGIAWMIGKSKRMVEVDFEDDTNE
jgi:outer membrane scaffolding protein for murein synthesis (MipA/OmpV family)